MGGSVRAPRSDNQAEDATNNSSTIKSVNILTKHNLCCANFCISRKVSCRGAQDAGAVFKGHWPPQPPSPSPLPTEHSITNSGTCCKSCEIYEAVSSPFFASWILFFGFDALHFHPSPTGARRREGSAEESFVKGVRGGWLEKPRQKSKASQTWKPTPTSSNNKIQHTHPAKVLLV